MLHSNNVVLGEYILINIQKLIKRIIMPGSSYSRSHSTSSSSSARRARTRQYRTVNNTSIVDETLFGSPNHIQKQFSDSINKNLNNPCNKKSSIEKEAYASRKDKWHGKPAPKETVKIVTKDLIRSLIVPSEDPSGKSIILPNNEFNRIKTAATVQTKEEKQREEERIKNLKIQCQEASKERKKEMKLIDMQRQKNAKLSDIEQEAQQQADDLLRNAASLRHEQEDEIKRLNEMILNAKCHAIRDAQVLEKDQIKKELTEEERRLDTMMEIERQNAIVLQEEIDKRRKEERYLGAAKVVEQIADNEQERLFELERKDQENVQVQKEIMQMAQEDHENLIKKHADQLKLREVLNDANNLQQQQKQLKKEQERMEDLKVAEYMKHKAEREAVYEAEQERIRIAKEKETARLRALQEKFSDQQAERDALRAKRAQEQTEREWRKREIEDQKKKHELNESLKESRKIQTEQKQHMMAIQAQQDRKDFERVLLAQKEMIEKERELEKNLQTKGQLYAKDLRSQVKEKEMEKIEARNNFFEEGVKLDEEARERRVRLDEVKKKKLDALLDAGIPEKYISQIKRKVNLSQEAAV